MNLNDNYTALLKAYKQWLQILGFAKTTQYGNPKMLHYFFIYLQEKGIFSIKQLETKHLYNYFEYLQYRSNKRIQNKALSPNHLNKNFEAIDKFLEFLHQNGLQTAPSPTKYRILNTYKADFEVLTPNEIKQLYKALPLTFSHFSRQKHIEPRQAVLRLILDLLYGCGLRRSEVTNIHLKDIDFDAKLLYIRQAKGYKDRFVPMSKQVYQNTQDFIYNHRKYFTRKQKMLFPYTKEFLPKSLEILLKEITSNTLKSKKITPHTLRHSIATHLMQNGMKIENISQFLGHSSLESTQIYTHINHDTESFGLR